MVVFDIAHVLLGLLMVALGALAGLAILRAPHEPRMQRRKLRTAGGFTLELARPMFQTLFLGSVIVVPAQ